jgi:hypothetical protein
MLLYMFVCLFFFEILFFIIINENFEIPTSNSAMTLSGKLQNETDSPRKMTFSFPIEH